MSRIPQDTRTHLVRAPDGGSYLRQADGSLKQLSPTTAEGKGKSAIAHDPAPEVLDLEEQTHDGSATALPPIEDAPRRRRGKQE